MFSVFKTIERYEEEKSSDNKVASTIIISIIKYFVVIVNVWCYFFIIHFICVHI